MNIYTWGYGLEVWEMLQSVKLFVNNNQLMIAFAFAVMLFMLMIRFIRDGQLDWKMFLVSVLSATVFLTPNATTFNVIDEAKGTMHTVSNIPIGLGVILSLESEVEKALLLKTEFAYSGANFPEFTKAGAGFSFIAPLVAMDAKPKDKYLQLTFDHWMNNCFLYDIAQGYTNLSLISDSTDLLTNLAPTVRYETLVFDVANPNGIENDCVTAYATFSTRLTAEANNYATNVLPQKLNMAGSPNYIGAITDTQALLNNASASQIKWIEQEMMKNMLDEGFRASASITGGELATTAYSASLARAATLQQWRATGTQAKNNLPIVRSIGISLLISVSVIVVFFAIASMSFKAMFLVFAGFITLSLWSPIAAIINYQLYLKSKYSFSLLSSYGSLSNEKEAIELLAGYAANLEWWYGAIPMISYMLISGGGMGAMYLMRDAGAGVTSGSDAGVDASKGNINYGNKNVNNASYNEVRANHESYVDQHGEHSNINTLGGTSSNMTGTDGTGGGFKATSQSNADGSGLLKTSNSAGTSTISHDNDGKRTGTQLDSSLMSNILSNSASASIQQARQENTQNSKTFSDSLSNSLADAQREGVDISDSQSLSNHFGVDSKTAETMSAMVEESENKSLVDSMSTKEKADISEKFGNRFEGSASIGVSSADKFFKFLRIGVDGKASGYNITERATGETYSHDFSSSQKSQYQESFSKGLSSSLSSNAGVTAQYADSVTNGNSSFSSQTKTAAMNYSESLSHLDSVSQTSNLIESQSREDKLNMNGKLLDNYIEGDEQLSRKWDNANNDNQRANVASTATMQMKNAKENPLQYPNEARKLDNAVAKTMSAFGTQEVFKSASQNINSFSGNIDEIGRGKERIENSTIPKLDGSFDRDRMEDKVFTDIETINDNHEPVTSNFSTSNKAIEPSSSNNVGRNILESARKDLGVREDPRASGDNERISEYHQSIGKNWDDDVAWCSSFVNYHVEKAGLQGTDSGLASSWRSWGQAVEPQVGAIAVKPRFNEEGKRIGNHVGIVSDINYEDKTLTLLGGNQGANGEVKESKYSIGAFDSFRMAREAPITIGSSSQERNLNKYDEAHNTLSKVVNPQLERTEFESFATRGEQGEPSSLDYLVGENRTDATENNWDNAEKNGLITQVGFYGSQWTPTSNFNEKVKDYSIEDLKSLQDQNGFFGYTMSEELETRVKDEISKKSVDELRNGNSEYVDYISREDMNEYNKSLINKR
jgi:conjugal transfer mating pair stabilization protein TraG